MATVYAATQVHSPSATRWRHCSRLDPERVRVVHREGAGCYGHNGADDVAGDAAILSRAVGRPVRVQWSRQHEFAWEQKAGRWSPNFAAVLMQTGT